MPVERHDTSNGAHLPIRKLDITASVIGALFNCHPFVTPLKLYVEKRGIEFPDIDNKVMRRGRWLEPSFPRALEDIRPEWRVEPAKVYLRDPELKLGATPDFFIHGDSRGLGVLQAKSVAPSVFHREWVDGEEIPPWIALQNTTECLLAEQAYGEPTFGIVAALTVDAYAMECHLFDNPCDVATREEMVARVKRFWDNVAAGYEPEVDFEKDRTAIEALNPHERPGVARDFSGNNQIPMLLARRATLCEEIRRKEIEREVIETELRFLMGDAEMMTGVPGWRVTYRTTDFKEYTVPARSRRVLRIYDRREGA